MSRSKKAFNNTMTGFLHEFVTLVCGLILPRLILNAFGSSYNGITSSITQFISVVSLMKAGIGGVTRAALYKPLSENNTKEISEIVNGTQCFMRRIAVIFLGFIFMFACIYPLLISQEFSWLFASSLVVVISLSTFIQYYFGITYQMLLMADQKQFVVYLSQIVAMIVNTVLAACLIKAGAGIHIVKLGSALAFALAPIILNRYAIKKYSINKNVKPNMERISQRWDAFGHEVANFVNSNTDIMVLTVFIGLREVSVYTVYAYVIRAIRSIVTNFIAGFGAAFGNMFAKNEQELLHENLGIFELIVFSVTTCVYGVALAMITPFALVYTSGITDVSYNRPVFGYIITLAGAFTCYRVPYYSLTTAAGHYRQTRNGAFLEAIINIVLSIICVIRFGLTGVAIGTLVAAIFRSTQYAHYLSKNILIRSVSHYYLHVFISISIMIIVFFSSHLMGIECTSFLDLLVYGGLLAIEAVVITIIVDLVLWKRDMVVFVKKGLGIFRKNE